MSIARHGNLGYIDSLHDEFSQEGFNHWDLPRIILNLCLNTEDNPEFINKPYGDFDDVHAGFHRRDYDPAQIVFFTTRQDGHQLNLTALSSGDDYDKTQSLIFDVKDYLPVPPSLDGGGMTSCAQLAAAIPSPTPASLDPDTASSIMVSLTRAECYATAPAKPHGYGSLWLAPGYF